jgi:hypothetical protein
MLLIYSTEYMLVKAYNNGPKKVKVGTGVPYVTPTLALCWIFYAQAGMPNKRLAQSRLVRMVLNKGEALA